MVRYIRSADETDRAKKLYDVLFLAADVSNLGEAEQEALNYDARSELGAIRSELIKQGYSFVDQIYPQNRLIVKSVDEDGYRDLKYIYDERKAQFIRDFENSSDNSFFDPEDEWSLAFHRVESANADIESNIQMKKCRKYVKSTRDYDFSDWRPEDIELWKSIDWKARNYEEYPVEDGFDSFITGDITIYGIENHGIDIPCTFQKVIRANPIYPPYYCVLPEDLDAIRKDYPDYQLVGPMYDGNDYDGYQVNDRVDTQEVYDMLFH